MLKKLRDAFSPKLPNVVTSQPTALIVASIAVRDAWTNNLYATQGLTPDFKEQQAKGWIEKSMEILASPDPILANRNVLAGYVLEAADLQVLVLDPAPAVDPSGLRGILGISGELKEHLDLLSLRCRKLAEFLHGIGADRSRDEKWNAVVYRYRIVWAGMNIFNALRKSLGDAHGDPSSDWFWPFLATQCAFSEHIYRSQAGLAPSLHSDRVQSCDVGDALLAFSNLVLDGVQYPDFEWEQRYGVKLPRRV
ncbi:hypothetical protein AWB67_06565 [Caballeronia terrestris]|uniref:Uncharacterized protein n=1 Tax=Caballeronia terrestris TaxID=1226301 RepID=A0A158KSQ4_9BURK|nr:MULTISPECIES: hypothetical protein [Caballeronia]SAL06078.1 hypothetical protein AWB81_07433 [Caballeronia arationis]SAL84005.1 hypothetical protein AWB67_06565 [Caballeronia terrestris]